MARRPQIPHELMKKYFRWNGGADNLPYLRTARAGRERGRQAIAQVMAELGFKHGIEIGTRYGQSARIWCQAIPGLELHCIDPYMAYHGISQKRQDKIYADAVDNLAPLGVTLVRQTSDSAVHLFADESVDFINIDGNHEFDFCIRDMLNYIPKVRKGGLVLIHDYITCRLCGVMAAVDGYTQSHMIDPWYVTRDYEPTAFWMRGVERA